jgi:hypothetical protein
LIEPFKFSAYVIDVCGLNTDEPNNPYELKLPKPEKPSGSDDQDSATENQKSNKQDGSDDSREKPEKTNGRSPKKRICNTAAIRYCAIGLEDGKNWWLFHKGSSVWEQIGKVDIPSGQLHKMAEQLADGEGSVSRNELIGLLQKDFPGMNGKMVNQKVTVVLSKLRKVIRDKIKVTGPFEEIDDPIPCHSFVANSTAGRFWG